LGTWRLGWATIMKIIKDVREEFKFNNEIHLTSLIATVSKK
jgi:hypothetical protein